jgi:hypothetical protein
MRSVQACYFAGLKTVNFRYFGKRVPIPALFHGRGQKIPPPGNDLCPFGKRSV